MLKLIKAINSRFSYNGKPAKRNIYAKLALYQWTNTNKYFFTYSVGNKFYFVSPDFSNFESIKMYKFLIKIKQTIEMSFHLWKAAKEELFHEFKMDKFLLNFEDSFEKALYSNLIGETNNTISTDIIPEVPSTFTNYLFKYKKNFDKSLKKINKKVII